ncbi:hypothetical protein J8I87_42520, partial [Paraburkholderia sp. LEh10]|uniref:hypothetical protein n=1 Tax=Paraburkholderia sp. LEh10 TaxID=2821353 RepID=UPI001AE33D32
AQLRGNGDGRNELYDLFLQMEGIGNGLFEKNGDVFDAYAAAMSGTKLTPASAWLLVCLGRAMNSLEAISQRLAKVAAKYDMDPPGSNGARGRRIQPSFLSENRP